MDLETQLVQVQSLYLCNVKRNDVMDNLYLDKLTESAVERENIKSVKARLRGSEYQVTQSISDVNPSKANIIAFIWYPSRQTYGIARQIRESFDNNYKFVKSDADAAIVHRENGKPPQRSNEGRQVVIGREFLSYNGQADWTRFKNEHPYMMFGVEFANHAFVEFRILTKLQLQAKFEMYQDYKDAHYNADDDEALTSGERAVVKWNLRLFYQLKMTSAAECLELCWVPDIWLLYRNLTLQMKRDHLAEIEAATEQENTERHNHLKSQIKLAIEGHRREYEEHIGPGYVMPAFMSRQFANARTMALMDNENAVKYNTLICNESQNDDADTALSRRLDGFFQDLQTKRQNRPT